jgi:hypothetical protein
MHMRWVLTIAAAHPWAAPRRTLVEFFRDPWLTVACVLLVVVSLGWVVLTRLIVHQLKKAAREGGRSVSIDNVRPARDIWSMPPSTDE